MARRIVYFTGNELLWECTNARRCKCLRSDLDTDRDDQHHGVLLRGVTRAQRPEFIYDEWWKILKEFTARNITHESDPLPALSGLAKFFQSYKTGEYLAGFWKEDILRSLLWSRAYHVIFKRSEGQRAPTWSPFSLVAVEKKPIINLVHDIPINLLTGSGDIVARLVDVETVLFGTDPTGHVKKCALTLAGRMGPVGHLDSYSSTPHPIFDEEYKWGDEKDDWTFFIMRAYSNGSGSEALVLRPSKKFGGCYERLGVVVSQSDSYHGAFPIWEKAVESTITLLQFA
jgi:hypothetical protein